MSKRASRRVRKAKGDDNAVSGDELRSVSDREGVVYDDGGSSSLIKKAMVDMDEEEEQEARVNSSDKGDDEEVEKILDEEDSASEVEEYSGRVASRGRRTKGVVLIKRAPERRVETDIITVQDKLKSFEYSTRKAPRHPEVEEEDQNEDEDQLCDTDDDMGHDKENQRVVQAITARDRMDKYASPMNMQLQRSASGGSRLRPFQVLDIFQFET